VLVTAGAGVRRRADVQRHAQGIVQGRTGERGCAVRQLDLAPLSGRGCSCSGTAAEIGPLTWNRANAGITQSSRVDDRGCLVVKCEDLLELFDGYADQQALRQLIDESEALRERIAGARDAKGRC